MQATNIQSLVVMLAASLALSAGCASSDKPPRAKPVGYEDTFAEGGEVSAELNGIWIQAELNVVTQFQNGQWTLFNRVGQHCWPESIPQFKNQFAAAIPEFNMMSDRSSVTFRRAKREGEFEMKPLETLPSGCDKTYSRVEVFDAFVELMRARYPSFSRRGVVFATQSAAVRRGFSQLPDDESLLKAMTRALAGLRDPELLIAGTGFSWRDPTATPPVFGRLQKAFDSQEQIASFGDYIKAWEDTVVAAVQRNYLQQSIDSQGDPLIIAGTDNNGVAYIRVSYFGERSVQDWRDTLRGFSKAFLDSPAIIIDVSMANGGSDPAAQAMLGWLLGDGAIAYLNRLHAIPLRDWDAVSLKTRVDRFAKPTYVVTSGVTTGAAERFVLGLRGRPGVRIVGEQTQGSLAQAIPASLPNGWVIQIPRVEFANRDEVQFEGLGIAPDFALELYPEGGLTQAHPLALQTLSDLIAEGHFN